MEETKCKFIVAGQYPSGIWNGYFACDDFSLAVENFKQLCEHGSHRYKAAAVFTREQWRRNRTTYRSHTNLRDRHDEPIPAGLGMWLVNQADSGYF